MSCAITAGYTKDCKESAGGIKNVYITELANKSSITTTSGAITAFTLTTGKKFWKYELTKATSTAEDTLTVSDANGSVYSEQKIDIQLEKMQTATRNAIKLLAANDCMIIVEDRNSKFWLYGEGNGMSMVTAKGTLGKAFGDLNGYTISFAGMETEQAKEVTSSLMTALQTAAV
jgi:hypothetical protein